MPDLTKVSGVAEADIVKISGVDKANIVKMAGQTVPAGGVIASRWIATSSAGKLYSTTVPEGDSGWSELVDLDSFTCRNVAVGEDDSNAKLWFIQTTNAGNDVAYALDSSDLSVDSNWTIVNVTDGKTAQLGGPGIAWGNGTWVAVGLKGSSPGYRAVMRSVDGGEVWSEVAFDSSVNANARIVAYKSSTTWFYAQGTTIFTSTDGGANWANAKSGGGTTSSSAIYAMAYNPNQTPDPLWVSVGNNGEVRTSDDDWAASAPETGGHDTDVIHGVVYAAGTINKWVTCGASGRVAYSTNGFDWSAATLPVAVGVKALRGIATDNTTIVVVGQPTVSSESIVLTSSDAVNWTLNTELGGDTLDSIACDIIGSGMR